jgi:hypothetical protein
MSVPSWCEFSGMGRTLTYEAIMGGLLPTVLIKRRRLIDVEGGLSWMRSQAARPAMSLEEMKTRAAIFRRPRPSKG